MDEHMGELRRSAYGQRLLYQSLVVGFVLGLAARVGGYLLRPSPPTEPLGLVADLLYALGYALWTGVVVALFVQVLPEVKRRQFKATLEDYEAARERPEPEATRRRAMTKRRRRSSGQG
jgi:putative copper export protein